MTFRAFIAVDIGPLPGLVELSEKFKRIKADLKLVEPENIHITLKFLGDTEETLIEGISRCMGESVKGLKPFDVTFEGMGVFPNPNYMKVIWVGLSGAEPLIEVSRKLDAQLRDLGYSKDKKGFKAHVTIARVRSPRGKSELQRMLESNGERSFGSIHVDRIILKKSVLSPGGPTYTDIHEVPLSD